MYYAGIDVIVNEFSKEDALLEVEKRLDRPHVNVMIHEQYFYTDYRNYQSNYEEKLSAVFALLRENGYESRFFEEMI